MSQALSVLDHAIRGDPDGLSFLEQTTSIYVLDAATTPGRPRTYGWWNFLNDALNDVERHESGEEGRHNHFYPHRSYVGSDRRRLDAHVRLLATIARRVARRSPAMDRRLVGTCLANASMSHMKSLACGDMAQSLLNNNDELRERNMGRIAAIVFDYSYHRGGTNGRVDDDDDHDDWDGGGIYPHRPTRSAFSDPVAMEQLCGILAANAVSSGPVAVRHLVSDWIVPSIDSLPTFAVVAVMSYIAVEAMEEDRPAGTRDVMMSLMPSVFRCALGPILVDSLRGGDERGEDAMVESGDGGTSGRGRGGRGTIASLAMRSLDSWCTVNSIGAVKLRGIFSCTNVRPRSWRLNNLYYSRLRL
jgi:hypothetical protein